MHFAQPLNKLLFRTLFILNEFLPYAKFIAHLKFVSLATISVQIYQRKLFEARCDYEQSELSVIGKNKNDKRFERFVLRS